MNRIVGLMILTLAVTLFNGCRKTKVKNNCCNHFMTVTPSNYKTDSVSLYVPNVFTPNGDGVNDLFFHKGIGVKQFNFTIYKGKNNKVYSTQNSEPWDGTHNGVIRSGIYHYKIEVTTIHNEDLILEGEICSLIQDEVGISELDQCKTCIFGDQIDPRYGYIYPTAENTEGCE